MLQPLNTEFGPIRSVFWPIHSHELRKVLPMFLMAFCVCFNYSILRNVKDALVVTSSGAAAIPFIKVWVMLPMAVLFTGIFTWLTSRYSQERVFYIIITAFLLMYGAFAFFIYPLRNELCSTQVETFLTSIFPIGGQGFVLMCRDWSITLFYTLSELWGSIVLLVLFWGFANEVTRIEEARRFYGVLAIGANLAAIVAGFLGGYFSKWEFIEGFFFGDEAWEQSLFFLVLLVIASGVLTMAVFRWMNKQVLTGAEFVDLHKTRKLFKKKKRLSLLESFSYLSRSKYLICIAVIVVAYNLVINLVEVVWKDQLHQLYPLARDYNLYLSNVTMIMGIVSTLIAVLLPFLIDKLGWTKSALITPVILLVTSIGFFFFFFYKDYFSYFMLVSMGVSMSAIPIAVGFGAAQNCLSKAAKYSVFDMTKEMAFIPLDHEAKLQGKAAIDGVGSRLGKSGGSVIHQVLLFMLGTLPAIAPYVAVIILGMIALWMVAVRSLGRQFHQLVDEFETEPVATTEEAEAATTTVS